MSSGGGIETSPTISETPPQKAAEAKNRIAGGQISFFMNFQYFLRAAASMKFRRGDRRKCSGARPAICRLRARGGVFRPENLSRQNFSSAAVGFGKFLAGARGKKAISNYSMRIFPSRPEISTIFCTSP